MAFRLFVPILAGATLRERLIACIGATIGIALTGAIGGLVLGNGPHAVSYTHLTLPTIYSV